VGSAGQASLPRLILSVRWWCDEFSLHAGSQRTMARDSYITAPVSSSTTYGIWPNGCFSSHSDDLILERSPISTIWKSAVSSGGRVCGQPTFALDQTELEERDEHSLSALRVNIGGSS